MRNVEQQLTKTTVLKGHASMDFTQDYCQLLLHEDSKECQSFLTSDGGFTPLRVMHGTTSAV